MSMDAYRNQAKVLVRSYLLADPYIPYTAVLGGIIACKLACDLTHLVTFFTSNVILASQKYNARNGTIGVCWILPLRSCSYMLVLSFSWVNGVIHHSLSGIAVAYSMFSEEGQLYTFMVLISEVTTPEINMRWFLETAGMKKSLVYIINGVARILLFGYLFYHIYLHDHQ